MKVLVKSNPELEAAIANMLRKDILKNGVQHRNKCLVLVNQKDGNLDCIAMEHLRTQGLNTIIPLLACTDVIVSLNIDTETDKVIWTTDLKFEKDGKSLKNPLSKEYFCFAFKGTKCSIEYKVQVSETEAHSAQVTRYKKTDRGIEMEISSTIAKPKEVWISAQQRIRNQMVRFMESLQNPVSEGKGEMTIHTWKQPIETSLHHQTLVHMFSLIFQELPGVKFASYKVNQGWIYLVVQSSSEPSTIIKDAQSWIDTRWKKIVLDK